MNRTVALASIIGSMILSPIVAIGISPTRDLLLGLSPDEAVLKVADEIDKSKVENDQKLVSIQAELDIANKTIADQLLTINSQTELINNQNLAISEQNSKIASAQLQVDTVKSNLVKQAEETEIVKAKVASQKVEIDTKNAEDSAKSSCESAVKSSCTSAWLKMKDYDKTHTLDSASQAKYDSCQAALKC